jgi:hypothetical protein
MANSSSLSYDNESALQTIWSFFPGIIKTCSAALAVVVIFTMVGLFTDNISGSSGYTFDPKLVRSYNYTYGNKDSKIVYAYFVDFQCPGCKANNEPLKKLKEEYKDRVLFVYKHNPLTTIHVNARQAAQAAQASIKQDKFVEYTDQLFANQSSLGNDSLETYAKNVGMDITKFKSDSVDRDVVQAVNWDQNDLKSIFLPRNDISNKSKPAGEGEGTPTSVILKDGKVESWWSGGRDEATIKGVLDPLLAK